MKKIKKTVLRLCVSAMLCLTMAATLPQQGTVCVAAQKSGLQKEGKNYYYYKKGKKIKNKWKTVGKYRYYFGKKGAAVKGLKKIKGQIYYFDKKCRMKKNYWHKGIYYFNNKGQALTGLQCIKKNYTYKLYWFEADGKLNTQKQKVLDAYNSDKMYQKPVDSLKAVIGEPVRVENPEDQGCMGTGRDVILWYDGFQVLGNEDNGVIYFQAFEK